MRFFLDNDVDAAVGQVIRGMGHECWTAADAGLSAVQDDELTVYAINQGAVLIAHDREFAERRRRNTIGRHIQLRCPQWEAAALVKDQLPLLVPTLEAREHVLIRLSADGGTIFAQWQ